MSLRKSITFGLFAGLAGLTPVLLAADVTRVSSPAAASTAAFSSGKVVLGQIAGEVRNMSGVSQMGAAVFLLNRYEEVIRRVRSNQSGRFVFDGLVPDTYSVRVSLERFLPAVRHNVTVLAGDENLLTISLADMFGSTELSPIVAPRGDLISDSWKWVLKTSHTTRPVLRVLAKDNTSVSSSRSRGLVRFSDTTGLVRVSAGDSALFSGNPQEDLGTAFAIATSVNDAARLRVSGNFTYAASGLPSGGIRTTYSRLQGSDTGGSLEPAGPRMSLTVRQIYLPSWTGSGFAEAGFVGQGVIGQGFLGQGLLGQGSATTLWTGSAPVLRTATLSAADRMDLTDHVRIEYGFSLDSVSLFGRVTTLSPFVRATLDGGSTGTLQIAVSSGLEPTELMAEGSGDLNQDITALSRLPKLSRDDGRAAMERNRAVELGYQVHSGSRTFSGMVFHEDVSNAAFLIAGATNLVDNADLLPDINSRGTIYNLGDYRRIGVAVAVSQNLGDHLALNVAAGRSGALVSLPLAEGPGSGDLRSAVHSELRPWLTVRAQASLARSATHLSGSYGLADHAALVPVHVSLTGQADQETGLNLRARQALPHFCGMRMELTAELRNLLAQGYLTMHSAGGTALLTNSPRAFKSGLNFSF